MKNEPFKLEKLEPDQRMVQLIHRNRPHLKKSYIIHILSNNVMTSGQLASLTGKRPEAVITMTVLKLKNGKIESKLTRALPFPEADENGEIRENTKRAFILLDEKCKKFIVDHNK